MASDPSDDSLVIADWEGNLYRIPRAVLEQCRITNAEPNGAAGANDAATGGGSARGWQAFLPREDGSRPPGPLPAADQ
jgi:hypothetical protein